MARFKIYILTVLSDSQTNPSRNYNNRRDRVINQKVMTASTIETLYNSYVHRDLSFLTFHSGRLFFGRIFKIFLRHNRSPVARRPQSNFSSDFVGIRPRRHGRSLDQKFGRRFFFEPFFLPTVRAQETNMESHNDKRTYYNRTRVTRNRRYLEFFFTIPRISDLNSVKKKNAFHSDISWTTRTFESAKPELLAYIYCGK